MDPVEIAPSFQLIKESAVRISNRADNAKTRAAQLDWISRGIDAMKVVFFREGQSLEVRVDAPKSAEDIEAIIVREIHAHIEELQREISEIAKNL